MISFELSLSLRYLKMRRHGLFAFLTTVIAVGGVTLGVAALIVTLAVMSGFRSDIQKKTLGIQPHVVLFGTERDSAIDVDSMADRLKLNKEVRAVAPFIMSQTLLKTARSSQGVVLRGIVAEKEFAVTELKSSLTDGDWSVLDLVDQSGPRIYLGRELSRTLGAVAGDEVIAISPNETAAIGPMGSVPKMEKFVVGGVFQSGMYEYDANMAVVSLATARQFFGITGATGLGFKTVHLDRADDTAAELALSAGDKYWARSWLSMNKNLFEALKLEKIVMSIILTMIILVASFTIISNLILMTIEKVKDIGILRSLGASRTSVMKIFLYSCITLGLTGTALGAALGIAIVKILGKTQWIKLPKDVYYIDTLPVKLLPGDLAAVLGAAVLITIISALYPARQAAKVNPVEAIRYG